MVYQAKSLIQSCFVRHASASSYIGIGDMIPTRTGKRESIFQSAVLPASVFKKQKFFGALFFRGVFFLFWEKCFLVLFFIKMCLLFIMMGKIIVNTAIYHNLLAVPNLFCLTLLDILTHSYIYNERYYRYCK